MRDYELLVKSAADSAYLMKTTGLVLFANSAASKAHSCTA